MIICDLAPLDRLLTGGVKRYLLDKRRHLLALPGNRHLLIVPSHRDHVTTGPGQATIELHVAHLPGTPGGRVRIDGHRVLATILREKPELIEVADCGKGARIGLAAGQALGVPVVAFHHADFSQMLDARMARWFGPVLGRALAAPIRRQYQNRAGRMAVNFAAGARLAERLRANSLPQVVQLPLGTDPALFHPRNTRARIRGEFGLPPEAKLLLFAGRLTRAKGLSALVAALDQLAPDGPPCHLALVGGGECAAWAQALAARRSNLTWLPHCESTDRLADLYSAADLFVYPGVSDTRAFAALEAQACGTPVLAVRGGGLEEVLAADPSPLFADDATSAALARALESARRRPELMPAERAARHRALIERFSIDRTFARIFALYREQLGSRPARGGPSG